MDDASYALRPTEYTEMKMKLRSIPPKLWPGPVGESTATEQNNRTHLCSVHAGIKADVRVS